MNDERPQKRTKRPEIGTKMYCVQEHMYYVIDSKYGPRIEYCVCEAEVTGFYTKGFTEVVLFGSDPGGGNSEKYYPLDTIGERLFYTPREAALYAQEKTERWEEREKMFGAFRPPVYPMPRTWMKYLDESR